MGFLTGAINQDTTFDSTDFRAVVPIPGTTKLHRLEEDIAAAALELTAEDLRSIEGAISTVTVQGARYPAHLQARVDR